MIKDLFVWDQPANTPQLWKANCHWLLPTNGTVDEFKTEIRWSQWMKQMFMDIKKNGAADVICKEQVLLS